MQAVLGASQQENLADKVEKRIVAGSDPEFGAAVAKIVRALHAAVSEVRPTTAQWRAAVDFLTEVGHASDERRQEWVLLSDLLGITQLVEDVNTLRPAGATPNTARGPFYRHDAPELPLGANISLDGAGERLAVTCHVRDLDGRPVTGAVVETWQANGQGYYENQQPDLQPEFNLRGIFAADAAGDMHYLTVKPAGYKVPDDGPVGQLLGRLGYPLHRPAHLHFIVRAPGFETVTTHVYDGADPRLGEDALLGVKPELVADFRHGGSGGVRFEWTLEFTFVLARSRQSGPSRRGKS
ncbi:MAG: 6-chlorohydroxyquinol-1,2-dioxygenase [Hyphomicrobiales bacterium]|nr:6-chlorohydroxyquinol-1,2-dioxygenase [Hyphomicrobiales bacterium]